MLDTRTGGITLSVNVYVERFLTNSCHSVSYGGRVISSSVKREYKPATYNIIIIQNLSLFLL